MAAEKTSEQSAKNKDPQDMTNEELVNALRVCLMTQHYDFASRPLAAEIMQRCVDAYKENYDTPAPFDDFTMGVVCRIVFWRRGDTDGMLAHQNAFLEGVQFSRRRDVAVNWLLNGEIPK